MTARQLVILDIETTGLNVKKCHVLEVSAINMATGESLNFVPFISREALMSADFAALQINQYFERGTWREMLESYEENRKAFTELQTILTGNTIGGSNPRFDADVLARHIKEVWHHRLADLAAYAAPAMGRALDDLPGLDKVCTFLNVVNASPHSALGDVLATKECFEKLAIMYRGFGADKARDPRLADFPITNMVP